MIWYHQKIIRTTKFFHVIIIFFYIILAEVGAPPIFSVVCFRWSAIQKQCFHFTLLLRTFQKFDSPLALVCYCYLSIPQFCYCYFHCSPLLLVRNSSTAIFTVVHSMLQFAIQQYQFQYQPTLFDNFFSLKYFIKIGQKIQTSGIAEAQFQQSASAGPLFLPVHWALSFQKSAGQQTSRLMDQNSGRPTCAWQ